MAIRRVRVKVGERWYTVDVDDLSVSPVSVTVEGETFLVEVDTLQQHTSNPGVPKGTAGSKKWTRSRKSTSKPILDNVVRSPMPGRVLAIMVKRGSEVSEGDEMCVVEAMKMEQSIRAQRAGVVKKIYVKPQQQVDTNDPLIELS